MAVAAKTYKKGTKIDSITPSTNTPTFIVEIIGDYNDAEVVLSEALGTGVSVGDIDGFSIYLAV